MKYYAHTTNDELGKPLPESSGKWHLLSVHLRNVANLAKEFAAPLGLADEAQLAGLLHDLGKYAKRFQDRLRNPAIHGINHWAAGAAQARTLNACASHTGWTQHCFGHRKFSAGARKTTPGAGVLPILWVARSRAAGVACCHC
jgi:hypothetical protein